MAELAVIPSSAPPARPLKMLDPDTKRAAVLRVFLERGERGLNRFEAERLARDHVLNTTVSECARLLGVGFAKKFEKVPCLNGTKTADVVRYSLTAEGAARVRELLGASLEAA